ncbi:MAG: hypothetical protein WC634_01605 [archaeon]
MPKESPKIPERGVIIRLLNNMPENYSGVKEHCLLCELAAEEIAAQLKEKGVKISPEFVSRAALAHDAFKQFGEKGNECFLAKDHFTKKGFPEFAKALVTNALQSPDFENQARLVELSLEQKIVTYSDDICRGIPIRDKNQQIIGWRNDIFPLDEAWKSIEDRIKRGEFKREGSIKQEFELVRIIEKELIGKGLDIKKLIRKVKEKNLQP